MFIQPLYRKLQLLYLFILIREFSPGFHLLLSSDVYDLRHNLILVDQYRWFGIISIISMHLQKQNWRFDRPLPNPGSRLLLTLFPFLKNEPLCRRGQQFVYASVLTILVQNMSDTCITLSDNLCNFISLQPMIPTQMNCLKSVLIW